MSTTPWKSNSVSLALLSVAFIGARPCMGDFEYFGKGIDYWNDAVTAAPKTEGKKPVPTMPGAGKSEGSFAWEKYLDPNNKEFFREGEYTPPEPFMELVRSPTDENLKMWFAYIDKKNELASRLQEKVQEYVSRHGGKIAEPEKADLLSQAATLPKSAPDAKRYRFRMYFNSQCPHCRRMFETLAALQAKGFSIEARQIDTDRELVQGPFPTEKATKDEIGEKKIESVPLLLIGDLKRKVVYRLTGYQSPETVLGVLNKEGGKR